MIKKTYNMPFLRFHTIDPIKLAEISREMTDRLQEIIGCPREHIVLEVIHSEIVTDGQIGQGDWPFIEVAYFERSLEIQDGVAHIICQYLKQVGYENVDIHFSYLSNRNYYENGNCSQ